MKNLAADNVMPGDTVHKMTRVNRESVVLRSKVDRRQLVRGTKWIRKLPSRIKFIADGEGPAIVDGATLLKLEDFQPTDTRGSSRGLRRPVSLVRDGNDALVGVVGCGKIKHG